MNWKLADSPKAGDLLRAEALDALTAIGVDQDARGSRPSPRPGSQRAPRLAAVPALAGLFSVCSASGGDPGATGRSRTIFNTFCALVGRKVACCSAPARTGAAARFR